MMLRIAVFTLLNVVLIQGCCIPKQWEGYEGLTIGYSKDGKGGAMEGYIKVAYDAINGKLAAESTVFFNGKKYKSKVIQDYGKKLQYVIYKRTCNTTRLENPFPKGCIPDKAKIAGFRFGAGNASLDAVAYKVNVHKMEATITVTRDGCIPVGELVMGSVRGVGFMENVGYVNITPGIRNPSVFNPPRICRRFLYSESLRQQAYKSPVVRLNVGENGVPEHMERFLTKSAVLGF